MIPAIKASYFVFIYRNHYLFMQRYEIVLIRREDEMKFISINIKKIIAEQNQCLSCYCLFVPFNIIEVNFFFYSSTGENSSLPTEQSGHSKSSGRSSKAVPAGIPASGTPTAGSYSQPQTSHTYFIMVSSIYFNLVCFCILILSHHSCLFCDFLTVYRCSARYSSAMCTATAPSATAVTT